jgi:biotin operon repressor
MSIDHDEIFKQAEGLCVEASTDATVTPAYRIAHKAAQSLENNGWRKSNGMTQNQKIMKHLKKAGSITVREAMVDYSIASLTKRVQELREDGHEILSTTKFHPMTGQKYVRYSLDAKVSA